MTDIQCERTVLMKSKVLTRTPGYIGLAKDMRTVAKSSDEVVKTNARKHLAQRMGKLHGLPQKIGQIMSMSNDATAANPFAGLSDNAQPIPLKQVRAVLEESWKTSPDVVVSEIDPRAFAASLGQVHRATLQTGETVAVKVAYPGIHEAVMADLKVLGWLSAPVGDLRRGFDLADYREEIVRDLREELDYNNEANNQEEYKDAASNLDWLVVPETFKKLSTDKVLVTTWQDGDTIDKVATDWPAKAKEELARRILRHFLTMLFDQGLVHGDPHPGNYRFRFDDQGSPQIVLYDFGSVRRIPINDRLTILRLITDSVTRAYDPTGWLIALGFKRSLIDPIRAKIPAVCSVLFQPFASPAKFDLSRWNRSQRMDDILCDDRWNFRMAGPANLILLMRAFRGVLFYLEKLGAPVSWERILAPILARHNQAAEALSPPAMGSSPGEVATIAKHLRIEIYRGGVRKVSLTLPASSVEDLPEVMGEDVVEKVSDQDIDLDEIVRSARRNGYAPMELFRIDDPQDDKSVRVWME